MALESLNAYSEDSMAHHLVMIPGLLCTETLFKVQRSALSHSVTVEIANHYGHNSLNAMARAILERAPDRFALAGLSMGGYLAFEILRLAPDRVERLALLNTSARADGAEQKENRSRLVALAEKKGIGIPVREMFPKLVAPSHSNDEFLEAIFLEMAETIGTAGFARQQSAIAGRPDSRPMLASIKCPTLVLVGEGDQLTPVELAKEMAEGIVGSRLAVIPDAGHLSPLEAPERVTHELQAWLKG